MRNRLSASSLRVRLFNSVSSRTFCRSTRFYEAKASIAKKAAPVKPFVKPKQYAYPEHLVIWEAGAPKIALVGTFKVMSVIVFGMACIFVAPQYVYIEGEDDWKAVPVMILGAIPLLYTAISAAPFVATIRMQLPSAIRRSRDLLLRFAADPPSDTLVEITTIRLIGLQKRTTLTLSELRPTKSMFGIANLERNIPREIMKKRSLWANMSYWMKEPRHRFYVGGEEGVRRSGTPKVWPLVYESIQRNARIWSSK